MEACEARAQLTIFKSQRMSILLQAHELDLQETYEQTLSRVNPLPSNLRDLVSRLPKSPQSLKRLDYH